VAKSFTWVIMIHNLSEFTSIIGLTPLGFIIGVGIIIVTVKLAFKWFPIWKKKFNDRVDDIWK